MFSSHTRYELGDGTSDRFWNDIWSGDKALKVAFLDLYGIACANNASIATHLGFSDGSNQ